LVKLFLTLKNTQSNYRSAIEPNNNSAFMFL
jgi:hypothetical protein